MAVVVDASAVVEWLARRPGAAPVEKALIDDVVFAPELLDVEVMSALARAVRAGRVSARDGRCALDALAGAPITRAPHLGLVADAWARRGNVSVYDAFYVALAARLACPLMTADGKLSRTPRLGITVTLLSI